MSIKSRLSLKSQFIEGVVPSGQDFSDLFDSMLNKKDDHFFGKWKAGVAYRHCDVVIYKKSLYILDLTISPECEEDPPLENDIECDDVPDDLMNEELCSNQSPDMHCQWCLMELSTQDRDFTILIDDVGREIGVARVQGRVGIGTLEPKAKLDVTDEEHGHILLNPNREGKPKVTLVKLDTSTGVKSDDETNKKWTAFTQEDDKAALQTSTLGFAFVKMPEARPAAERVKLAGASSTPEPLKLLLLLSDPKEKGRVKAGVGTDDPQGVLDLREGDRGKLLFNPGAHPEPELLLVSLEPKCDGQYLLSAVNGEAAIFSTDAEGGFRFKRGESYEDMLKQEGADEPETLVVVHSNGKVGVGTESPESALHITDNDSGAFRVHLDNDNPVAALINERPSPQHLDTYLALGADDDYGALVTSAPSGFVFKKGGKSGQFGNDVNINQGDNLVYIHPEGRLGVSTVESPEEYELEVNGKTKSLSVFLETDGSKIEQSGDLASDDVFALLEKLEPILFKWKGHTKCAKDGEQIGFNAQNIYECIPQAVKKTGAVKAYSNAGLTAFLTEVIKRQQKRLEKCEDQICELYELIKSLRKGK